MSNQRRRLRVEIGKMAFARGEQESLGGVIENISSTGASITFVSPLQDSQKHFKKGDSVDIVVSGMSSLTGWVIRCDDHSMAVEFAHDEEGEKRLVAEIMDTM